MASALKGAVILSEIDGIMRWTGKCDGCGQLDNTINEDSNPGPNVAIRTSWFCPRCQRLVEVEIAGD